MRARALILVAMCVGCGSASSGSGTFGQNDPSGAPGVNEGTGSSGGSSSSGSSSGSSGGSFGSGGSTGGSSSGSGGGGTASSGGSDAGIPDDVLTAGAWDDNRNYDFFNGYLAANASLQGIAPVATSDRDAAFALFAGNRSPKQRLDIAIVIDTTGSMGDEAAYLSTEFQNISAAIESQYPSSDQHWALVAYRDRPDTDPGDNYVVQSWDFTTDLTAFQTTISGLTAAGGGDYPEAPDLGLAAANTLSWRPDADVARLAFWVADAPQHDQYSAAMVQDFSDAHGKDIHLYPVSASGADELLEYTMRSGAQVTGGRYLFLTDDSGIGDSHLAPTIPCYFVTKLGKSIVRMVSIELSGVYAEPDASDIIRVGGNPMAGQCAVDDGGSVTIF
ncbi:MAG TPA: VWA domain-containing protein [Polyangiaceae bacterium]|jgi:hypothetical protein|nr:VWA domain-containing protein [Polyangiaceae bacterium]